MRRYNIFLKIIAITMCMVLLMGKSFLFEAKSLISIEKISIANNSLLKADIFSDSVIETYTITEMDNPARIIVDINSAKGAQTLEALYTVNNKYLTKIRTASHNGSSSNASYVRVVFDMTEFIGYDINLSGDGKILSVVFDQSEQIILGVDYDCNSIEDTLRINMSNSRKAVFGPREEGCITITLPDVNIGSIEDNVFFNGNFVHGVTYEQNGTDALIKVYTEDYVLLTQDRNRKDILFTFSDPEKSGIGVAEKNGYPVIALKSKNFDFNYFNYSRPYVTPTRKFYITIPESTFPVKEGFLYLQDGSKLKGINIYYDSEKKATKFSFVTDIYMNYNVYSSFDELMVIQMSRNSRDATRYSSLTAEKTDPKVKNSVVVIDPGHGGTEKGATYPFNEKDEKKIVVQEKDLNLDISLKLRDLLEAKGVTVYMTRTTDATVELEDRVKFINSKNPDLFISVHNNAGSDDGGTMTLYYPSDGVTSGAFSNERMAQIVQQELLANLGTKDLGMWKRARLAVLRGAEVPGVLAEVAYISNTQDRESLMTEKFRQKSAQALCNGVIRSLYEMKGVSGKYVMDPDISAFNGLFDSLVDERRVINGFKIPSREVALCDYNGSSEENPSIFNLSVKANIKDIDSKKLKDIKDEIFAVLVQKLDDATIKKVTRELDEIKTYKDHAFNDEISGSGYTVWVRHIKGSNYLRVDVR